MHYILETDKQISEYVYPFSIFIYTEKRNAFWIYWNIFYEA